MARLGLILGDQLNADNAVLAALDRRCDVLVMGELGDEIDYVWHHAKKIILIFSAMRHFAEQRRAEGWVLHYHRFTPDSKLRSFGALLTSILNDQPIEEVVVSQPGEWRVLDELRRWASQSHVPMTILPDTRFICSPPEFADWADGRKQLRMEFFYRRMRRRTGFLMDGARPVGGKWNLDQSNRRTWRGQPPAPAPPGFAPDRVVERVIAEVKRSREAFGQSEGFDFPVTRSQALVALESFVDAALPCFGHYQDAMAEGEDYLFHSRLSSSLNLGLIAPLEVCAAAERAWRDGRAPLNAVEGFIRQIIGWREFVRGIYWREMPAYAESNTLGNRQALPGWYWTGQTRMHCLAQTIDATRRNAYAHHIQRLMVTGNFALLLGVVPSEICAWYLAVYADAYDWVELPNTLGMVMHADGGLLGSKPYAASGKYIDRMSNYCKSCHYAVADTLGQRACPFNALYWDFLIRHQARFAEHPRMKMVYRHVLGKSEQEIEAITGRAAWLREHIETL